MSVVINKKVVSVNGNKRTINAEIFNSADECANVCQSRAITDSSFDDMRKEASQEWHGADYDGTMELLRNGYQPTVDALKGVFKANVSGEGKRFKFQNSPVGFAPIVPLALMGVPNSMLDMRMKPIKAKVVDVYIDMTCSAYTSSDAIMKTSKKVLSAVIELERQGYRFNLYSCTGYFDSSSGDAVCVKVKSAEQPLDLKRVSFPMAHTAFFRVLGFDWYSKFPLGKYRFGYGHAAYFEFKSNTREMYQQLFGKKNIVFFSVQELIANGNEKAIKEALENGNSKN